jgi:CRAL/TRIO domain
MPESAEFDAAKVTAEMEKLEKEDEFEDAIANDADEGIEGNFAVTADELALIRADLATEFPDDYQYLSDAYIKSVASKPYSKDPTKRRPIEYSQEKLQQVMQWREEAGAPDMEDLLKLGAGPSNSREAIANPARYAKAVALCKAVNNASLYWHGFTKDGHPILWIRTNRKPWYPDVEAEVNALILMADTGIKYMPDGVTDFVCISESSYPPPPNPSFMINLLKALVRGYPDRLNCLYSAPVSSIIQFVMNLLLPLMPGRLASKVILLGLEEVKQKCTEILPNGADGIPVFLGGSNTEHDSYYPDEGKTSIRGKGVLKFDYFGMLERLQQAKDEYEQSKK